MEKRTITLILYLHKLGISLSHVEFLRCMEENVEYLPGKHKLINDLVKLGYVYNWGVTDKGAELLGEVDNWDDEELVFVPKKEEVVEYSKEFLEFWGLFPSIDSFEYAGQTFNGVRNLKTKKKECSVLYEEIIKEVPHEVLIKCLNYEIEARKDMSVVRKANQLTFMNNTHTWLYNRKFEPYIRLSASGPYKSKSGNINRVVQNKVEF